jgi:hypothetical protein
MPDPAFKVRTGYIENPTDRAYGMDYVTNFIHALEGRRETEFDDLVTQTFICLWAASGLLYEDRTKLRAQVRDLEDRVARLEDTG